MTKSHCPEWTIIFVHNGYQHVFSIYAWDAIQAAKEAVIVSQYNSEEIIKVIRTDIM